MTTIEITTADTAYARRNNDRRRGYADAWHSAWRAAGRARGVEHTPANVPAGILALAERLATLTSSGALAYAGHDETARVWIDGQHTRESSSLPAHAGPRSTALSLAIELVARLEPGAHTITLGTLREPSYRSGRAVSVEVAA